MNAPTTGTRTVARQCTLCEAHCGILVTATGDRVDRIEGDPQDVLSKGYICPKATALADLHHDPERLRRPVKRVGDAFEEIGWDEAFDIVGRNLRRIRREHGPSATAMYLGNPAAHSPSLVYGLVLRAALLTKHFYTASSVDQFPQEFAAFRTFGSGFVMPVVDIDRTDRLVVMGANPAVSNGSLSTMPDARGRIRAVRDRGGTVVVIDPRRTETARLADEHVAIEPGGDLYLLLAMLHVLFDEELVDTGSIGVAGAGALAELAATCPPEVAAPMCGVDVGTIRKLARDHAAADSAALYARVGVCHQVTGTLVHWLVTCVNVLTGNLDRAGGMMFTTPPVDLMRVLKHVPHDLFQWSDRSGEHRSLRFELPVSGLADDILDQGEGQIRAMVTHAGNPVLSTPQRGRLDEALESLDFMVSVDMYVTETTRHADVILPPVSQLERDEFDVVFAALSVRNNARYNARVFDPPEDGLEDWEILARLALELVPMPARSLTGAVARRVVDEISPERLASVGVAVSPHGVLRRGPRGLTVRRIRRTRGGIDLGALEPRLDRLIATRDGSVQVGPPDLVTQAHEVVDAALAGQQIDAAPDGFDLRLIGLRHLRSNNSWLHNVQSMVKGRDRCTVLVHPDDAVLRGLDDRARATVTSSVGVIELPVEVSDEIRPGTVAIPHGWGHDEKGVGWSTAAAHGGVNVNLLHDPAVTDRSTGNAAMNATWVRVEPTEVPAGVSPAQPT